MSMADRLQAQRTRLFINSDNATSNAVFFHLICEITCGQEIQQEKKPSDCPEYASDEKDKAPEHGSAIIRSY
jgi:hypothetical protein